MKNFDLSVIIPTYNRKNSLYNLLELLNNQIDITLEIIIVDQNAINYLDTKLLDEYKVQHIRLPLPNASLARNVGFIKSTSSYVLFIDDDLEPDIKFCKKSIDIFNLYDDIKCFVPLVFTEFNEFDSLIDIRKKIIYSYNNEQSIFIITDSISAVVYFRRDYFFMSGGFDPHLFEFSKTSEDQELFFRMNMKGMNLAYVSDLKVLHNELEIGGCELRTSDYWVTREKCIKAACFRYRIHRNHNGRLFLPELFLISRSFFLNKEGIKNGFFVFIKQVYLLFKCIKSSKKQWKKSQKYYLNNIKNVNHLIYINI